MWQSHPSRRQETMQYLRCAEEEQVPMDELLSTWRLAGLLWGKITQEDLKVS